MTVDLRKASVGELHAIFADGFFARFTVRERVSAGLHRSRLAPTCSFAIPHGLDGARIFDREAGGETISAQRPTP